ncbi:MAG: hypothetical protein ACM4AI_11555 [Acidobacteriota bacterium]
MAHGHTPTWEMEDEYWRGAFRSRPYCASDTSYDDWRPAYRYGYESAVRHEGRAWDDRLEDELRTGWDRYPERTSRDWSWQHVKDAVRDAWNRLRVTK